MEDNPLAPKVPIEGIGLGAAVDDIDNMPTVAELEKESTDLELAVDMAKATLENFKTSNSTTRGAREGINRELEGLKELVVEYRALDVKRVAKATAGEARTLLQRTCAAYLSKLQEDLYNYEDALVPKPEEPVQAGSAAHQKAAKNAFLKSIKAGLEDDLKELETDVENEASDPPMSKAKYMKYMSIHESLKSTI